jgi:hypothetical protein
MRALSDKLNKQAHRAPPIIKGLFICLLRLFDGSQLILVVGYSLGPKSGENREKIGIHLEGFASLAQRSLALPVLISGVSICGGALRLRLGYSSVHWP